MVWQGKDVIKTSRLMIGVHACTRIDCSAHRRHITPHTHLVPWLSLPRLTPSPWFLSP